MDDEEFYGVSEVVNISTSTGEKKLLGDIGDVTFCMANYVKEAMKVILKILIILY